MTAVKPNENKIIKIPALAKKSDLKWNQKYRLTKMMETTHQAVSIYAKS